MVGAWKGESTRAYIDWVPHPSLDQYRESIHTSVVKDLENVEKALVTGLEELTVDLDHHFDDLANIEEPLQKPFDTETLSIQPKPGPKQQAQEVLLQDRITAFRKLREEKEKILCKLWEDWEDIQFRLIGLAAEVLGQDTLAFAQVRDEDMKPGQREKLENALEAAQKIFDANGDPHDSLAQDLEAFEENVGQIASKTKSTVSELQQQYNVQKNKLFKGLHRHIELLAAL
ncbi:hypothetical protein PV05_08088 [Exophiala xenobiotica]|uniref:Uncharacterized protein n=1 Tax=Exophiala xenobiotica TaxID=348802 RepID=A0A0D2EAW4_9EURO|nr:uncharacterized protein PV05_08088 [Exophiala xenobiotica]KIW52453.1 hypothetical protein PV05_08088 [Exophiala xenobiotica]